MDTFTLHPQPVDIDGVRLEYVESGDPDGAPVVFLHGVPDSWRSFSTVLRHLPDSIRALAVTQRGHGDADRPAGGYDPARFAADLEGFLDALDIPAAALVGHSMGSLVAQRFAIDHPERTRALVLIGALPPLAGHESFEEVDALFLSLTDPVSEDLIREFQAGTVAQPLDPEFLDTVVAEGLKLPARIHQAVWRGLREADFTVDLTHISAPTLLIWGDRDDLATRELQDELLAAIPSSRLRVYHGAGHSVQWEQPARVAVDLAAFVTQHL